MPWQSFPRLGGQKRPLLLRFVQQLHAAQHGGPPAVIMATLSGAAITLGSTIVSCALALQVEKTAHRFIFWLAPHKYAHVDYAFGLTREQLESVRQDDRHSTSRTATTSSSSTPNLESNSSSYSTALTATTTNDDVSSWMVPHAKDNVPRLLPQPADAPSCCSSTGNTVSEHFPTQGETAVVVTINTTTGSSNNNTASMSEEDTQRPQTLPQSWISTSSNSSSTTSSRTSGNANSNNSGSTSTTHATTMNHWPPVPLAEPVWRQEVIAGAMVA